mmetsp:Transcript_13287/g.23826  ORF Transcript_13287/g.23826 Transcript_13287/m.23826 type:complete len:413 (-) Transcript_13287:2119-3357(-)
MLETEDGIQARSGRDRLLALWLLGVLNNSIFVILNAGAKDIVSGGVGLVYLCNTFPGLLVQVTGPYWFHLMSYTNRVAATTVLFVLSVSMVAFGKGVLWMQLLGVSGGSFAGGLGEATFLGLMSYYGESEITAWSSGTGFAGIYGYTWKALFTDALGFPFSTTLLLSNVLPLLYFATYHFLLDKPPSLRETEYTAVAQSNDNEEVDEAISSEERIGPSSIQERMRVFLSLWPFTIPLLVVYISEYSMQSGAWAATGFPIDDPAARAKFYLYSNWLYQVGVFCSRSSGFLSLDLRHIWFFPCIQAVLLIFFSFNAVYHIWWNNTVLLLCLLAGFLGGAVYVHTFCIMSRRVPSEQQEFALASAVTAATFGTAVANILGVILQGCLYGVNGISDGGKPPTFRCGYKYRIYKGDE